MTHHGDVAVNADNGMVRIKGRNICIDATNQLTLQANKIQIGHVQPGKTQDFQVTSTRVDLGKPKRGNMCKVLKTCATTLSFAKSLNTIFWWWYSRYCCWCFRWCCRNTSRADSRKQRRGSYD